MSRILSNLALSFATLFSQGSIFTNLGFAGEVPSSANGSEWRQWRGPNRDAKASPGTTWPSDLKESHLTKKWRVELGDGYPGPIVSKDRVFPSEPGKKAEGWFKAFNALTVQPVWEPR